MTRLGLEPDDLYELARRVSLEADALHEAQRRLSKLVSTFSLGWGGPEAATFRRDFRELVQDPTVRVQLEMRRIFAALGVQRGQQERVSAADGPGSQAGMPPLTPDAEGRHIAWRAEAPHRDAVAAALADTAIDTTTRRISADAEVKLVTAHLALAQALAHHPHDREYPFHVRLALDGALGVGLAVRAGDSATVQAGGTVMRDYRFRNAAEAERFIDGLERELALNDHERRLLWIPSLGTTAVLINTGHDIVEYLDRFGGALGAETITGGLRASAELNGAQAGGVTFDGRQELALRTDHDGRHTWIGRQQIEIDLAAVGLLDSHRSMNGSATVEIRLLPDQTREFSLLLTGSTAAALPRLPGLDALRVLRPGNAVPGPAPATAAAPAPGRRGGVDAGAAHLEFTRSRATIGEVEFRVPIDASNATDINLLLSTGIPTPNLVRTLLSEATLVARVGTETDTGVDGGLGGGVASIEAGISETRTHIDYTLVRTPGHTTIVDLDGGGRWTFTDEELQTALASGIASAERPARHTVADRLDR